MIRRLGLVLSALLVSCVQLAYAGVASQISVTDDTGQVVKLAKPAQRIISLAPNLTEILFAIGAGDKVVGVSSESDFPPQAKAIARVASFNELNLEAIIESKPDLIVAWLGGNPIGQLTKLKELHIPVYSARFKTIADIPKTMQKLSILTGTVNQATPVIKNFNTNIAKLRHKYAKQQPVSVFYQVWHKPIFTISDKSIINQVIGLCGGRNVFAKTKGSSPQVSVEAVLVADPQVILAGEDSNYWRSMWQFWHRLRAVHNNNLYTIPPSLVERPGPRLWRGARLVCEDLALARSKSSNKSNTGSKAHIIK